MAQKGKLQIPFVLRPVGFLGDGQNRYVASVERYSTIGYKEIVAYAARAAHVPETDITMAMDALYDALSYFVCNGHGVKLPNLGIFTFGINAKATVQEANAGADAVYRTKVNFLPVKELREVLDNVAITTVALNPNGLTVGPGNDPRFKYVELRSKAFTGTVTYGYPAYPISADGKIVLRMSQPLDYTPKMYLNVVKNGEYNQYENIQPSAQNGATYTYDLSSLLQAGENYRLVNVGFLDKEGRFNLVYFEFSAGGSAIPNGMSFMGKTVREYPVQPTVTDYIVSPSAEYNRELIIYGCNMNGNLDVVKEQLLFDDVEVTEPHILSRDTYFMKVLVPEGVKKITVMTTSMTFNYTIAEGESGKAVPVITSLTANGVSVNNNGTSTVEVGGTYNFRLKGANLNLLATDGNDFGAALRNAGTRINVTSVTSDAIDFTCENMQAGTFQVKYNNSSIFSLTLTAYTPSEGSVTITSIGGVVNTGDYAMPLNVQTELDIVGTNLDKLTQAGFTIESGSIVSLTKTSATAAKIKFVASKNGTNLRYTDNGSVLFQLHISDQDADVVEW